MATDLDDFLFREYHPTQGRWVQPDPAGLAAVDAMNPQSWNRYGYVANNPLRYIDPTGLCSVKDGSDTATDDPGSPCASGGNNSTTVDGGAAPPVDYVYISVGGLGLMVPAFPSSQSGGSNVQKQPPQPPRTGILTTVAQKFCSAIPDARTITLDAGAGGLGSVHGSVTATLDYKTGLTSFSAAGGFQVGWNGVLSGQFSSGFVYGSSDSNRSGSYSGGAAVSPYYSRSGNAGEFGLGVGVSLLGSVGGGRTASVSTASVGAVPGLEVSPLEYLLEFAKQVCK